jgi:UDP-N-acetylmuramoyl-tripeptide--D-alanyl-D-alanine ligase
VEAVVDGAPVAYGLRQSARHWGPMSLAAVLLMRALDVDLDIALRALARFEPLEGRGAVRHVAAPNGAFTVIDESYNASPLSVAAALATLGARHVAGRRIAVLTDMLELGPDGPARHAALAGPVDEADIDLVFCAGPLMRQLFDALPPSRRGAWAPDAASLAPSLLAAVAKDDAVMVKGSKASKASMLAQALLSSGVA